MRTSTKICLSLLGVTCVLSLCRAKEWKQREPLYRRTVSSSVESEEKPEEYYASFELQIKSYIADVKREQLTTLTNNSRFLEEIDKYMAKLPTKATMNVTTQTRDTCHCEGHMMTPCPAKCVLKKTTLQAVMVSITLRVAPISRQKFSHKILSVHNTP
ncbi:hypothetical protein GE061_004857 [Apolygus lucorum]|uniref:Uncharacterized protein n=1 Tax=Apolygus lucorum TaxID=248454 RepID=A0A8S9X0G0_APOLU|nr:hypothetical protein GE061_004857 [Apolygus lucorum]